MPAVRLTPAFAAALLLCLGTAVLAETFQERMTVCLDCHGKSGTSENPVVPSLGAQPAPYVLIQLFLFREKQRVILFKKDDQMIEVMNEMTKGFTDDDLRTFSDYIAKLPAPKADTQAADPGRLARGQASIVQHRCNFCHMPDLSGGESIPRIRNQREDYIVKTMRDYKSNYRPGYDAAMANVVAPLSDADILDLAHAIARMP